MAASHSSSYFASIASTLSLNLTRACESGSSCHTHRLRCGPCPLELPLLLVPCFHRHLWSRDRTRPWRCIDLNAYRYPRLNLSGSCMSSRSVALVNNLSPNVDNANTGSLAAREIITSTPYIDRAHEHINAMSLLHLGIIIGLSGSLVGWITSTGCRALVGSHHVPRTSSVKYSIGHLGEYSGQSLRSSQAARFCGLDPCAIRSDTVVAKQSPRPHLTTSTHTACARSCPS